MTSHTMNRRKIQYLFERALERANALAPTEYALLERICEREDERETTVFFRSCRFDSVELRIAKLSSKKLSRHCYSFTPEHTSFALQLISDRKFGFDNDNE